MIFTDIRMHCKYDVIMLTFDAFKEAYLLVFNDEKLHFIDIMGIMNKYLMKHLFKQNVFLHFSIIFF